MAISASTVTTTDTLENFRVEFNNLVADVESLQQVGASNIVIADGGNIGSASDQDAISIAANGVVTFSQAPSFTTGLLVSDLDIDGATDISAAIVDADLFIIDDGASGTNRKTAASRIKTYIADVTLTTAAQTNITSVGTLTALDVDNININGNTITASTGAVNITPASGSAIVLDGAVNIDAGVVTGITSLTSNAILIADAGTIGSASSTSAITIASTGIVTFVDDIIIKDAGTIGSASDTDAISISSGGVVNISATTANTNASDGALTVAGGVGIALDASIGDDLRLISDSAILSFGANSEITVTHVHDVGLTITNTIADTDNRPTILQLKSEEDAIVADDVIASIEMAAGDSDGTDGAVVAAGIHAIAEGTFAADANATKLVFTTGVSETAAASATAKMTLSSAGLLTIADDLMIKDGGTIGVATTNDAITIASTGIVTFKDDIIIKDGGTIGSASDTDAISISSGGVVAISATTANTDASDGALTVAGGASVAADFTVGDDLRLKSDSAILSFGTDNDIHVTHLHNSGLKISQNFTSDDTPLVLQLKSEEDALTANEVIASLEFAAGDSDGTDAATVAAGIHAIAEGTFSASANPTKLVFTTGVSETAAASATAKMALSSTGNLTIAGELTTTAFSSTDFAAAFVVIEDGGTDGSGTDAGDNIIIEDGGTDGAGANAGDDLLMENVTSWVTSGFTIRDSFGNHLQTVNGVS